ncbi:MAG: MBL fold metallo-hydrolase [Bacilli bacterium]|nr:MBL fold metallo-hydrolase [Bacilli bacterium]MBR6137721.1 MBL fold metallo-hydrolase [Bacilli bacterium]
MKIEVLHHASIKLTGDKIIYFDPYKIEEEFHDADYIFITHDHYDHYDPESIEKVRNDHTKIVVPYCLKDKEHHLLADGYRYYEIDGIKFTTIPSYNINKQFHPREKYYVGYNILLEDRYYYIMGDTDRTPETDMVKTDICFVPIGGTYTMDVDEAAEYINDLKPQVAIPIHYGMITGDLSMGKEFQDKVNKEIKVEIKIGE